MIDEPNIKFATNYLKTGHFFSHDGNFEDQIKYTFYQHFLISLQIKQKQQALNIFSAVN